jgi:hypothetical protein
MTGEVFERQREKIKAFENSISNQGYFGVLAVPGVFSNYVENQCVNQPSEILHKDLNLF